MKFQAVIFDMDGLLMDSERTGLKVMHACGLRQGVDLPEAQIMRTIGANRQWSSDFYRGLYPTLDTDRLFDDFRSGMIALAAAGEIPLKKGAAALLDALRGRGIPCAVASSSGLKTIAAYLEAAGSSGTFPRWSRPTACAPSPRRTCF